MLLNVSILIGKQHCRGLLQLDHISVLVLGCVCRSATERVCRLQEALDERKQQFNNMATK